MSLVWISILLLAAVTFAFRAAGPVALGGRELPGWLNRAIAVLPAALMTALVVSQTLSSRGTIAIDARVVGVAVAGLSTLWGARMAVAVLLAAAATAGIRML
ncbi:MAG: hypothetical protein QOI62_3026 [Solirubrobacteraceae bacterium]|jgi:branched-subunit amino acid transport protein|nr:hypothetical protein [Solirubrobacteraceae bacterium]MEA2359766.1 hypothetical protein [Solirubrobacteraceae bacterium]